MNKTRSFATSVLIIALLAPRVFGDEPNPVTPTVIFLSRESNAYHPTLGARPTMSEVGAIVEAARKILKLEPYPSEYFENVVIVDEGDNWFVSFHARGNGNVKLPPVTDSNRKSDGSGYFLENTNAGIYLEKKSLTRSREFGIITKPISCLPLVSPMGERVQGLGTVAGPIEKTSK